MPGEPDRKLAPIVYYVTAHGLGHASRSFSIIKAFASLYPEIPIIVVTEVPRWFVNERLAGVSFCLESRSTDVGLVQKDPLEVDRIATADKLKQLLDLWGEMEQAEVAFLQRARAGLVVCDVPSIPLAAAARCGITGVLVANFTWDWIYQAYSDGSQVWEEAIKRFRSAYECTGMLLRLPFAPPIPYGRRQVDIPLPASPGRNRRGQLEAMLGVRPGTLLVLLAFSALPLEEVAIEAMARQDGIRYVVPEPLQIKHRGFHTVSRRALPFTDLLASVDIVLSKAGFGIVSDCIVNRKPLVMVRRPDFPESRLMEQEVPRYIPCELISERQFRRGEVGEAIRAVWKRKDVCGPVVMGGAELAAEWLRKEWYPAGAAEPAAPGGSSIRRDEDLTRPD